MDEREREKEREWGRGERKRRSGRKRIRFTQSENFEVCNTTVIIGVICRHCWTPHIGGQTANNTESVNITICHV